MIMDLYEHAIAYARHVADRVVHGGVTTESERRRVGHCEHIVNHIVTCRIENKAHRSTQGR